MNTDELERLKAVRRFDNYQFNLNKGLQDILILTAEICETPVAFLTLIDQDHQEFKVCMGMDVLQMPRDTSFCTHTIMDSNVMVVEDPLQDERFATNPLVLYKPHIRFYAGAPLSTEDGQHVGTLCVLDAKPNMLSEAKRHMLGILAKQAIHLMELDLCLGLLNQKNEKIAIQNKVLKEIAFTQAHEFRGPLSSIIGFMNLIKEEDYHNPKEYLMLMDEAVTKLDEKILLVVRSTEMARSMNMA